MPETLSREEFDEVVEASLEQLPDPFKKAIDNVGIHVEDLPDDDIVRSMRLRSNRDLLGLYQGIPLPARGTWYGATPVLPDRITLYQKNIERECSSHEQLRAKILEVLVHEIGHYFGMTEEEIRLAGY
jgi:predicted Zn-dependent protease with MMP-like domain